MATRQTERDTTDELDGRINHHEWNRDLIDGGVICRTSDRREFLVTITSEGAEVFLKPANDDGSCKYVSLDDLARLIRAGHLYTPKRDVGRAVESLADHRTNEYNTTQKRDKNDA